MLKMVLCTLNTQVITLCLVLQLSRKAIFEQECEKGGILSQGIHALREKVTTDQGSVFGFPAVNT